MHLVLVFHYIFYKLVYLCLFLVNDSFLSFFTKNIKLNQIEEYSSGESDLEDCDENFEEIDEKYEDDNFVINYAIAVDRDNFKSLVIKNKLIILIYLNYGLFINHLLLILPKNYNRLYFSYTKNKKMIKRSIDLKNEINLDTGKKIYFNKIL